MRRRRSKLRWWFSGRILACHAGDRGSIPRQRKTMFLKKYYCDGMLMQLQMCWTVFTQYSSHVVKWLGSGALTAMARVRFPAWEF